VRGRVWGLVVAGAVVVAGCGTGGGDAVDRDQVAAAQLPPVSKTVDLQAQVDLSVMRLSDLPAGWAVDPDQSAADDPDDDFLEAQLQACLGIDAATTGDGVDSPDFTDGHLSYAGSSSYSLADVATATSTFATLTSEQAQGCYRDQLVQILTSDPDPAQIGDVTVEPLPFTSGAEATSAVRYTVPLLGGAEPVPFSFDFVFVRQGQLVNLYTFMSAPQPAPADLESAAVDGPVSRLSFN
jgi:hypothetical protein